MKKLFVGNLPWEATEADVQQYVVERGLTVSSVHLIRDKDTARSKGYAFVELQEPCDGALDLLDNGELMGRVVHVEEPKDKGTGRKHRSGSRDPKRKFGRDRRSGRGGRRRREGGDWA